MLTSSIYLRKQATAIVVVFSLTVVVVVVVFVCVHIIGVPVSFFRLKKNLMAVLLFCNVQTYIRETFWIFFPHSSGKKT